MQCRERCKSKGVCIPSETRIQGCEGRRFITDNCLLPIYYYSTIFQKNREKEMAWTKKNASLAFLMAGYRVMGSNGWLCYCTQALRFRLHPPGEPTDHCFSHLPTVKHSKQCKKNTNTHIHSACILHEKHLGTALGLAITQVDTLLHCLVVTRGQDKEVKGRSHVLWTTQACACSYSLLP